MCSNLFKCVQNCSKIISLSSARGPTCQAELDLFYTATSNVKCLKIVAKNNGGDFSFHFGKFEVYEWSLTLLSELSPLTT